MLEFRSVSKVYDTQTTAVDNVSVEFPKSEFCVLLGSSGAGKTTFLRMTNGLVKPTSGEVILDGTVVSEKSYKILRPRIAMIHQQLDLVQRLSVINNVLSGSLSAISLWRTLAMYFPMSLRRKACYLLDQVGLTENHLYRRVASLSGGQQQRVATARAFILNPKIVLADEPVASLDPITSRSVLKMLKATSERNNATVLCSLHQIEYALEIADRIIGFAKGRLVFDGPPECLTTDTLEEIYEGDPQLPIFQQTQESFDALLTRQALADPSLRVEIIV